MSTVTSSLKVDHLSCNLLAFDREINVLLHKDDSPSQMAMVTQDVT